MANGPRLVRIYVDASSEVIEQVTKPDASSVPPAYTYNGAATAVNGGPAGSGTKTFTRLGSINSLGCQ